MILSHSSKQNRQTTNVNRLSASFVTRFKIYTVGSVPIVLKNNHYGSVRQYPIRGQRVMLDFDLARLYQVETKALNQAVKRNPKRFEGEEFMFQLTKEEWEMFTKASPLPINEDNNTSSFTDNYNLRSQIVTSRFSDKWGGNRRRNSHGDRFCECHRFS